MVSCGVCEGVPSPDSSSYTVVWVGPVGVDVLDLCDRLRIWAVGCCVFAGVGADALSLDRFSTLCCADARLV